MRSPALGACPRVSLLCVAVLGSLLSFGALARADGWPMAGHDAEHSGTAAGPSPPYRVAWTRETGEDGPVAGVAVTDEAAIVITRTGVLALDPADGAVLWERGRSPGPAGVPAVAGDLVLHARDAGVSGQIVARDVASGDIVWQATLGSAAQGGPTVAEGTAFVGTSGGEVVALDLATGEERWRFETRGGVTGPPAVAEGVVVAAAYQGSSGTSTVYALDASAGGDDEAIWRLSPGAVGPPSAPSIGGSRAYVGMSDLIVRALELRDGAEVWTFGARDGFGPRQVPAAGEALVVSDRTHVYRVDPETGEEAWTFLLADLSALGEGRSNTLLASAPGISGRTALLGSGDGTLSAIDLDSGHRVWLRDLGDGAVGPVAVNGERIYAVTLGKDGTVVALEHDPDGRLVDEVSPTVLFPARALLNFAAAVTAVGAVILLLFRFILRPRSGEPA